MSLMISGRPIDRIQLIDDDPNVRASYVYPVEELSALPIMAEGPYPILADFIQRSKEVADAAICDFQLRAKNYAGFNGAETVALMYQNQYPAILCTKYEQSNIDDMRKFRRYIPVLLKPNELNPSSIIESFELCIKEFTNQYSTQRKPWRTLVRVDDLDKENGYIYVIVPAWDSNEIIRIKIDDLPKNVREKLAEKSRFHALVNIGAEYHPDIYFEQWESD
jgi:hypothetical protein